MASLDSSYFIILACVMMAAKKMTPKFLFCFLQLKKNWELQLDPVSNGRCMKRNFSWRTWQQKGCLGRTEDSVRFVQRECTEYLWHKVAVSELMMLRMVPIFSDVNHLEISRFSALYSLPILCNYIHRKAEVCAYPSTRHLQFLFHHMLYRNV